MIPTVLNGMITLMMAKFFLNDVPHYLFEETTMRELKVMRVDERGATGPQLHYIAILSARLKIPEPVVKGFGEAGRIIRQLETEEAYRKKLKTGGFRLERTTVDKVIDDLDRTWHRIESDMDTRMQSSLSILKNVMSYYYEEPCVVAWDNSNLVGIAVYRTTYDVNIGVRDTRLKELASFTYRPGVGKNLTEEITRIGREEDSDIVSVSYGPGARGFYEKLGFVRNTYYPEEPTLMMYKVKNG